MQPQFVKFRDTEGNEAQVNIESIEGFKIHDTMGHGILTTRSGCYYLVHPEHNSVVQVALSWFAVKPPKAEAKEA
jgi:hypothetical protein